MLGGDWCESLRRHGLIRQPELAILQAAQRVGNLPWALTEMADSVRRRLAYRVQAVAQLLFPPIVILMGLVVMFIVVALFLPLISLISKLAGEVTRRGSMLIEVAVAGALSARCWWSACNWSPPPLAQRRAADQRQCAGGTGQRHGASRGPALGRIDNRPVIARKTLSVGRATNCPARS